MTIAQDKMLHFVVGACVAFGFSYFLGGWVGFVIGAYVGALKEVYDSMHPDRHTAEKHDFFATAVGAVAGALPGAYFWGP